MRKSAVYAKDVFKIALVGACMKHVNHHHPLATNFPPLSRYHTS